ncbi:hypothetical protein BX600DRAFT_268340 [Xylariales sp. PMI_506]|nr:hypothetical protein BX600DRAFT_268340 [Xylariales sp. PMI_506]
MKLGAAEVRIAKRGKTSRPSPDCDNMSYERWVQARRRCMLTNLNYLQDVNQSCITSASARSTSVWNHMGLLWDTDLSCRVVVSWAGGCIDMLISIIPSHMSVTGSLAKPDLALVVDFRIALALYQGNCLMVLKPCGFSVTSAQNTSRFRRTRKYAVSARNKKIKTK